MRQIVCGPIVAFALMLGVGGGTLQGADRPEHLTQLNTQGAMTVTVTLLTPERPRSDGTMAFQVRLVTHAAVDLDQYPLERLAIVRDHGCQARPLRDDGGEADSIRRRLRERIGIRGLGLGKPEQRPEVIAFLHEVDAVEGVEPGDLTAVLGGVLPRLIQLPKGAGESRCQRQNESGAQAGNRRAATAPAP